MTSLRQTLGINCNENAKRYLNSRLQSLLINIAFFTLFISASKAGPVAQLVKCLATDVCLTADPGVASSIKVRSHTSVEIDHEMISSVIRLSSAHSFKKGCPTTTIAVDLGHKATKQTINKCFKVRSMKRFFCQSVYISS